MKRSSTIVTPKPTYLPKTDLLSVESNVYMSLKDSLEITKCQSYLVTCNKLFGVVKLNTCEWHW